MKLYRIINLSLAIIVSFSSSVKATNYYVSPSGNNTNDGLSPATAWASIDNGDQIGVVNPGDTVKALPGIYALTWSAVFNRSGSTINPIVYEGIDPGWAIFDGGGNYFPIIVINAENLIFSRLMVRNTNDNGFETSGEKNVIQHCIISQVSTHGFYIRAGGDNVKIYNNTIYGAGNTGVYLVGSIKTARIINNIIDSTANAIRGPSGNRAAHNNIWRAGSDYIKGIVDSAGGLSVDPQFADPASENYALQFSSPCIDAGMDLGYPYDGIAPDMGAIEFIPAGNQAPILSAIGSQSVNEGQTLNFLVSAIDPDTTTPALAAENVPANASFVDSGNGSGSLIFNPDFTQAGIYNVLFIASDDSASDSELVTITVSNVNRTPVLTAIGAKSVEEGQALGFGVSASDPDGTTPTLEATNLPANATFIDSGNGVGYFDFTPSFTQEGIYTVFFIAFDGDLADSEAVVITVTPAPVVSIDVTPDSVIVEQLATLQFSAWGFDAGLTPVKDLSDSVTWSTTDATGFVTASGMYTAGNQNSPPEQYVKAVYQGSMSDSGRVTVIASGGLSYVRIEWVDGTIVGDTAFTTDNDSVTIYCRGYDIADSLLGDVSATWSVIGSDSIGAPSPITGVSTTLNFSKTGVGTIVASHISGEADSTGNITISSGILAILVISPDSVTLRLDDSVQFTATGYDADSNVTAAGQITWKDIGRSGRVDSTGLFVSTAPGAARVSAVSDLGLIADTSGLITIEELFLTTITLGDRAASPGEKSVTALAFNLHNYFDVPKSLTGITVRDQSSGLGNRTSLLLNIDSVALFLDVNDDSILNMGDSLLAKAVYSDTIVSLNFPAVIIPPDSGRTFLVALDINFYPRDGDTTNVYLTPASDIAISDSTVVSGPVLANSFENITFDGALSMQILRSGIGNGNVIPTDTAMLMYSFDYPRNGYSVDTLNSLTIANWGNADAQDFAGLFLYADNGNFLWDGYATELLVGELVYTGGQWTVSGISEDLSQVLNRFYIGVQLDSFPTPDATIRLGIPVEGVRVASSNDGPLDQAVVSPDTSTIQFVESVLVEGLSILSSALTAGSESQPLFGFSIQNARSNPLALDSVTVTVLTVDPSGATQLELESQIDSVRLYAKNGADLTRIEPTDSLIASTTVSAGLVTFDITGFQLPASGGKQKFIVTSFLNELNAKNGNTLNFALQSGSDLYYNSLLAPTGMFPISNPTEFIISTFSLSEIVLYPLAGVTLVGGTQDAPVLDFSLPNNGYNVDRLLSLTIQNFGSVQDNSAVKVLRLWRDATGNGFTADDSDLGAFQEVSANLWTLNNLSTLLFADSTRFIVTANISNDAFVGGTLKLGIPVGGAVYISGTDGPDDSPFSNPNSFLLVAPNRITVVSAPRPATFVSPGVTGEQILTFALYNGYVGETKTLNQLSIRNLSRSASGINYADLVLGQLSLYFDSDGNRLLQNDSLLTIGTFNQGDLTFTGVNLAIPPETLSYFFVTSDVAILAIDSDSLAVSIEQPTDFVFLETVNINGDVPVTRGGYAIVDGSVHAQYTELPLLSRSISPADSSVPVFVFIPASNGNLSDTIKSITVTNLGDAGATDISSLELWLDINGDSVWQATDSQVSTFTNSGSSWIADQMQILDSSAAPILFVLADISASAPGGKTIQLSIPINGCQYNSANDGPRDSALNSTGSFTISTSPIAVSLTPLQPAYTVGQSFVLEILATNNSGASIDSFLGSIVNVSEPSFVTVDSAQSTAYNISNSGTASLRYFITSVGAGNVFWTVQVIAPTTADTSVVIKSETIAIESSASPLRVDFVNSIPTAVTRGQKNVVPFTVTVRHSDTAGSVANVLLDSLRIKICNGNGIGILASDVFSEITLLSGYSALASITSIPADSIVTFAFNQPVTLTSGQSQSFTVLVSIDAVASASDFMLKISNASSFSGVEINTGQPIMLDSTIAFPLATATCRIDDAADRLFVSYSSELSAELNYGQTNALALTLYLRHAGSPSSSQIQVTNITVDLIDELGQQIPPAELVQRISVSTLQGFLGEVLSFNSQDTVARIAFGSPFTISPGQTDSLQVLLTVKQSTPHDKFAVRILDSVHLTVRDLTSGATLPAVTDPGAIASGSVFPIISSTATLKSSAPPLEICIESLLPVSIAAGRDSLDIMDVTFSHPGAGNVSGIRIENIRIRVTDSIGFAIDSDRLFDRIGFTFPDSAGGAAVYQSSVTKFGSYTVFEMNPPVVIIAGESVRVRLIGDIEPVVPFDHFVVSFDAFGSLSISDNTDTSLSLTYDYANGCIQTLPFSSSTVDIFLPASKPTISSLSYAVKTVTPGERSVLLPVGSLSYTAAGIQGDIILTGGRAQVEQRVGAGFTQISAGSVFESVALLLGMDTLAIDTIFAGGTVEFQAITPGVISVGEVHGIAIQCDLRSDLAIGNYIVRFIDSAAIDLQDMNLGTSIEAFSQSGTFPLSTAELSVSAATLEESFANYPNPFNPSLGEETTITFALSKDATIDIELFSVTGELVYTLLNGVSRKSGSHQSDKWAGLNDVGLEVMPGTYICRISARYVTGEEEMFTRRVAVIR